MKEAHEFINAMLRGDIATCEQLCNSYNFACDYQDMSGNTILMLAIVNKNIEVIDIILSKPIDINIARDDGHSALSLALSYNVPISERLINMGALVNQMFLDNCYRPLMLVAKKGLLFLAEIIISKGAVIQHVTLQGYTALTYAVKFNHTKMVKLLLKHVESTNLGGFIDYASYKGETALIYAVLHNNIEMIRILFAHGANINKKNSQEHTPLTFAVKNNKLAAVKELVRLANYSPDIDLELENIFHYAIRYNNKDVLHILLTQYSKNNQANNALALFVALKHGSEEICGFILEYVLMIGYTYQGYDLLTYALKNNKINIAELLLSKQESAYVNSLFCRDSHDSTCSNIDNSWAKLDIGFVDVNGNTALCFAAKSGDLGLVKTMLSYKAEVNYCNDSTNISPLMIACIYGHVSIANELICGGAQVNPNWPAPLTPLMCAAGFANSVGHVGIVKLLLSKNANANYCSSQNYTPLLLAAWAGNIDIALTLLSCKADVNNSSKTKYTPLMLAVQRENIEMAKLLITHGAKINYPGEGFHRPISIAICKGNEQMFNLLLQHNASVLFKVNKKYYDFCLDGYSFLLDQSLQTKANNILREQSYRYNGLADNCASYTTLFFAILHGNMNIVNSLLKKNTYIYKGYKNQNYSQAMLASISGNDLFLQFSKPCRFSFDFQSKDCCVFAPLFWAIDNNNMNIVRHLLHLGANIDIKSQCYYGYTPLLLAVNQNNYAAVKLLLESKANVNAKVSYGYTALMLAVNNNNKEITSLCFDFGANVNHSVSILDKMENSLFLAVKNNNIEILRLLLSQGAVVGDSNGSCALSLALNNQATSIIIIRILLTEYFTSRERQENPWLVAALANFIANSSFEKIKGVFACVPTNVWQKVLLYVWNNNHLNIAAVLSLCCFLGENHKFFAKLHNNDDFNIGMQHQSIVNYFAELHEGFNRINIEFLELLYQQDCSLALCKKAILMAIGTGEYLPCHIDIVAAVDSFRDLKNFFIFLNPLIERTFISSIGVIVKKDAKKLLTGSNFNLNCRDNQHALLFKYHLRHNHLRCRAIEKVFWHYSIPDKVIENIFSFY